MVSILASNYNHKQSFPDTVEVRFEGIIYNVVLLRQNVHNIQ